MIDTLKLNADYYFQTHTTNPLLKLETIDKAIYQFLNNNLDKEEYDSLYSVKQWQTRLYDIKSNAINHNPNELLPTQDLENHYLKRILVCIYSLKNQ